MPTTVPTSPDHRVLEDLRALARDRPRPARARGWEWLTSIDATDEPDRLAAIFELGAAPDGPDGDCEGAVLGLFGTPFLSLVDRLVRIGGALGGIGWTGKSFDAASGTGYNRLTRTSRIPMFLAMPRYGFGRARGQLTGFPFHHRLDTSPLDPAKEVRGITYDSPEHANPLMLPRTRDELVELTPGLYLGRALLHDEGRWSIVAYFALRHPVGG